MNRKKAVVLLSGGLDSTITLAIASNNYNCTTLSFDYGQRHSAELECAKWQSQHYQCDNRVVQTLDMSGIEKSALTNMQLDVPSGRSPEEMEASIPITYVPARNTVFLAHATQLAEQIDASAIFIGVNAVDYSGYPDCRPEYIEAYQNMINLATKNTVEDQPISICTPLIHMSKVEIVQEGIKQKIWFGKTCSCYNAKINYLAEDEFEVVSCGICDSCILRDEAMSSFEPRWLKEFI